MAKISRRNFFAAGAAAGVAAAGGASAQTAKTAAAPAAPKPAAKTAARASGRAELPDVYGADFMYQWSPPANVKRDLTPGKAVIRLCGQASYSRMTNTEGTDYDALFAKMAANGWTATEAGSAAWLARKVPSSEVATIKAAAKKHDVVFYNIHCAGNIIAPDPDADRWQRHIIDAIHSAEEFGCPTILTHVGSMYANRNWAHPLNWSQECYKRSVGALKRICRDTKGSKVAISIEPVNTEFLNNPWAMKRLQEDVGDERLRCGLDITNMVHPNVAFRMSELTNVTFELLGDRIFYLHAKDFVWNEMLPGMSWAMNGTGNMDYELWLAHVSRLTARPEIYVMIEFLNKDEEYAQAQKNMRAIAEKIGVAIHGKQA
jgi:sugar phosphate isomerase/epimerase